MPVNAPMRPQATQAQTSVLKYQIAIGALALGLSGSLCADALEFSPSLPYVGADVYQRNLTMVQGYGSESFAKRMPQGNLYIGTWFNDYFGLEGGWTFTQTATREVFISEETQFLGTVTDPAEWLRMRNKFSMNGAQLNIMGRLPIKDTKMHLIGSIGMTALKVKASVVTLGDAFNPFYRDADIQDASRKFSSRRIIPSVSGGVSYKISDGLSLRLLARYELTGKFNKLVANKGIYRVSLKNNLLLGGGLFVQF